MKTLVIIVSALGILAIGFAFLVILFNIRLLGVTGAGFLRGATALFLLSLVMMKFDKRYIKK